jgi:hypothetical protein
MLGASLLTVSIVRRRRANRPPTSSFPINPGGLGAQGNYPAEGNYPQLGGSTAARGLSRENASQGDAPGSAAKRAADRAGWRSNTGRRPDRSRVHRFDR